MLHRLSGVALLSAVGVAALVLATGASAQRGRFGGYSYQSGQDLYQHVCQGCHMADAKGAVGAGMYPALAGDTKLRTPLYPAIVILRGQKAMPSFPDLTDAQIAAVTNYVRSNFGNNFTGTVTPEQVGKLRPQQVLREAQRPG